MSSLKSLLGAGGGYTIINTQEFTSSGTWTKPAGAKIVEVVLCGGGGGGGSADGTYGGQGGNGGSMIRAKLLASALGATEAVTIGAGGTGGPFNQDGTYGGSTTFSVLTAGGGAGGLQDNNIQNNRNYRTSFGGFVLAVYQNSDFYYMPGNGGSGANSTYTSPGAKGVAYSVAGGGGGGGSTFVGYDGGAGTGNSLSRVSGGALPGDYGGGGAGGNSSVGGNGSDGDISLGKGGDGGGSGGYGYAGGVGGVPGGGGGGGARNNAAGGDGGDGAAYIITWGEE